MRLVTYSRSSVMCVVLALAAAGVGCSSSSSGGTGGASGTGGKGTGGGPGTGGRATGGTTGTGGSITPTGGATGTDAGRSDAADAADARADVVADASVDLPVDVPATSDASDASSDALAPGHMTLTSTALAPGAAFATANTCGGVNTSPALTWTAGPAGTMSYAVSLVDLTINAVHWVIYNVPSIVTSLPADLPPGKTLLTPVAATQIHKAEFFGTTDGAYRGPCPMGVNHNYQFEVTAINTATLAGVTVASSVEQVRAAVVAAGLDHGDLAGTSNASAPPADAGGQ
jgi:Raf kinase inhibitor-like YbhB/YbcL family protein